jgi:hypothetical protein
MNLSELAIATQALDRLLEFAPESQHHTLDLPTVVQKDRRAQEITVGYPK